MKNVKRTKPRKPKTEMCEAKDCTKKPTTVLGGYWFCDEHGNRDYEKHALSGKSQTTGSVVESKCSVCGTEYFIANNAGRIRTDKKMVWPKGAKDYWACRYRCDGCKSCVHETVEGAQFE